MEYITVRAAAQKWEVSERVVQQYCTAGRIPGARKFSGSWAIPQDAERPEDRRTRKVQRKLPEPTKIFEKPRESACIPMPLLNGVFTPGHCMEYVSEIKDVHLRDIALAEYYYFSGQAEKASQTAERYLAHPDLTLRLSACLIYAYANLSIGQIHRVRYTLAEIRKLVDTANSDMSPQLYATLTFVATAATVLLHLPLPQKIEGLQDYIRLLPPGLRMFALYVQAHYTYLQGDYGKSIGIVETAFAMQVEVYPIPSIYMHLVAVMDYMSLKQPERAQAHLLAAWELARPDDLIEGFGEHHGLLGGMLEAVLKKDYPEDFKRIISITYRFSAGWRKVHNPVTGHDVADNLTTTEFATAMLAARGWTNQEIADHLGISLNTVKQYISTALQKLNIRQRKDLKRHMLR